MSSKVMYITHVSLSLGNQWQWTKPCRSPEASYKAAENMVSSRILEDRNIPRNFDNFSVRLRILYPDIVEESQQFIGETREVHVPEGMAPKEFQSKFHTVNCDLEDIENWQQFFVEDVGEN